MTNEDPFGPGPGQGRRPWFAPKRFGHGYVPSTWQGFVLTGVCILFIIILAAITGGHSPVMVLGLIPFAIIFAVAYAQNRR
jgi:hypothetical protein